MCRSVTLHNARHTRRYGTRTWSHPKSVHGVGHGSVIASDGMIAMVAGEDVFLSSLDGRVLIQVDGPAQDPGTWGVQNAGLLDAGRGSVNLTAGDVYSLAANHSILGHRRN